MEGIVIVSMAYGVSMEIMRDGGDIFGEEEHSLQRGLVA